MDIKEKILSEMNTNLTVNQEIGEKTIFFTSIIVSIKNNKILPIFTTITNDELKEKINIYDFDYARFNKAKQEFADAISKIIKSKYSDLMLTYEKTMDVETIHELSLRNVNG